MAGSTPIYGFPYPQSTDLVADYPTLGQELATDVETVISGLGSGLNIVSATSIANSGGTATRTNGQVIFTGVNSISLNGAFTSAYSHYKVMCDFVASTGLGINMRMRAGGTDNTSSIYYLQRLVASNTSVSATRPVNPDTYFGGYIQGTASRNNFATELFNPQTTQQTSLLTQNLLGNPDLYLFSGFHDANSAFDGITLYTSTGTITGTLRVYGYKNS